MEIGYCDSTTDRDELHLPEKVPGMDYQCQDRSELYFFITISLLQYLHICFTAQIMEFYFDRLLQIA